MPPGDTIGPGNLSKKGKGKFIRSKEGILRGGLQQLVKGEVRLRMFRRRPLNCRKKFRKEGGSAKIRKSLGIMEGLMTLYNSHSRREESSLEPTREGSKGRRKKI